MKKKNYRDEHSLWDAVLAGNDEAYASLFDRYARVMFMYGSQFCGDREVVKECIQDVFVNIWFNRNRLARTDNVKYYLFGALRNSIINALKKESRRNALYEAVFNAEPVRKEHIDRMDIEEDEKMMHARISEIMDMLSPRQRQVIYYRYIDNLSITEISDLLNMSYQAVLNTIQRAIKRVRMNSSN